MEGMLAQPEQVNKILETVTTSLIRWLEAQLGTLCEPLGILLLDDLVGGLPNVRTRRWSSRNSNGLQSFLGKRPTTTPNTMPAFVEPLAGRVPRVQLQS